jgi:hypothetical protein
MAITYEPISTSTITGSTVSSVTFSSIPQTYTDLVLIIQARGTFSQDGIDVTFIFNGDTSTSSYSLNYMTGNGSNGGVGGRLNNFGIGYFSSIPAANNTSGVFSANIHHIMNYASTTTLKTVLNRNSSRSNAVSASVGLWRNTAAINSIQLQISNGSQGHYVVGSTLTLYGIKEA